MTYLPHYPSGESDESKSNSDSKLKKRDSTTVKELMSNTFAHRRHDVVSLQMSIKEIKDRWPALFDVSQVSKWHCSNTEVNTKTSWAENVQAEQSEIVLLKSKFELKQKWALSFLVLFFLLFFLSQPRVSENHHRES